MYFHKIFSQQKTKSAKEILSIADLMLYLVLAVNPAETTGRHVVFAERTTADTGELLLPLTTPEES